MKTIIHNLDEMGQFAQDFLAPHAGQGEGAIVFALYGDLGSGKTAFTKGVAQALGITDPVSSPTFVIEKRYPLPQNPYNFESLIHIDAYRLDEGGDLQKLGIDEDLENPKNLIIIEWADIVEDVLPPHAVKLHFTFVDESTREVVV